jgi:rod shape-determining protein MreB
MDEAIINYIRRTHNLLIGEATAERIKKEIGSAVIMPNSNSVKFSIKGRSLADGVPKEVEINQGQIAESLAEVVAAIAEGVKTALENTAPELSADIVDRGIVMTGGGALLANLGQVLSETTGVPVFIADNPLNCVVMGTGRALEEMRTLQNVLINAY